MIKKLEKSLWQLRKTKPSQAFKEDAKRRLFSKMQKKDSLWVVRLLKNIFKPLPETEFVKNAWIRLANQIEINVQPTKEKQGFFNDILGQYNINWNRYLASVTAVFVIAVFVVQAPNTSATARTELLVSSGFVEIKSIGEDWISVDEKQILKIGDQVRTGNNSFAEIVFPDYSVVRIAESTHINISQFYQTTQSTGPVVLQLQEGRIWSSIISKKQDFFVETKHSRISANFGVFDVEANGTTHVRAMQNAVHIEPRNISDTGNILLSAGFQTEIADTASDIHLLALKKDEWSQENQKKDLDLREQILEQETEKTKRMAGILPGSPLYEVKEVLSSLSKDSLERVQAKFASAKVLASLGREDIAHEQFREASEELKQLWASTESAEDQDRILGFLDKEKTMFTNVLPGDSLFVLKDDYRSLFVFYASNPKQEELNQVAEKMLEIQGLVVQEDTQDARLILSLNNFVEQNQELAANVEGKEDLERLLTLQNKNLTVLQELAKGIKNPKVKKETIAVKQELVDTINSIVSQIAPGQGTTKPVNQKQAEWFAAQIQTMVDRVTVYETTRGQLNTIHWILENIENKEVNLGLLYALKDAMPEEVGLPISKKILQVRQINR